MMKSVLILDEFFAMTAKIRTLFLSHIKITNYLTLKHGTFNLRRQRLQASREVTIPLAFSKCEETGRYKNFEMAAHPSDSNKVTGYSFDDTDVYKTIEVASYLLQTQA